MHTQSNSGDIKLYPMKLQAAQKEIIWGGTRLKTDFNKPAAFDKIAESWELTVRSDGMNAIENGIYLGLTLEEYIQKLGGSVISDTYSGDRFPLLIKFIDACDKLSIQVHPDDEYSLKNEGEYGKTEMWYIIEADEGAQIVYGLKPNVTKADFKNAVADDRTEETLNYISVKKGDVYFIPSGLVHAIGAGILIAEIQQNSNITYRVYDYKRKQSDGSLRQLHTEKALETVKLLTAQDIEDVRFSCHRNCENDASLLASCDYFTVNRYDVTSAVKLSADKGSFNSIICISGGGEIKAGGESHPINKGDSYYIPAGMGAYEIIAHDSVEIIVSKI